MRVILHICLIIFIIVSTSGRRYRKNNEVGIVNLADASVKLRCQSVLVDKKDRFLPPQAEYRFKFIDIMRGNNHFWCDVYGLFDFDKAFDVFGRAAPSRSNLTWFIKSDGLYLDRTDNRVIEWLWRYPPFHTYAD